MDTSKLVTEAPTRFQAEAVYLNPDNPDETVVLVSLDRTTEDFNHILRKRVVLTDMPVTVNSLKIFVSLAADVIRLMCDKKEPPWYPGEQISIVIPTPLDQTTPTKS